MLYLNLGHYYTLHSPTSTMISVFVLKQKFNNDPEVLEQILHYILSSLKYNKIWSIKVYIQILFSPNFKSNTSILVDKLSYI
jgi:hypothetical protein